MRKWRNKKYDDNSNVIYYENIVDGAVCSHWIDYDELGRKIKYRDSLGESTTYIYYKDKTEIYDTRGNGTLYHTLLDNKGNTTYETIYRPDGITIYRDYTKRNTYRMYLETIYRSPYTRIINSNFLQSV